MFCRIKMLGAFTEFKPYIFIDNDINFSNLLQCVLINELGLNAR